MTKKNKSRIQLAVFDLIGTTVQDKFFVQKILINAFEEFGIPISLEDANTVMGLEKKKAIKLLLKSHVQGKISTTIIEKIHKYFMKLCVRFYSQHAKPMPYAGVVFKQLKKRNIKIAVNSGFDRKLIDLILEKMEWQGLIDTSISSDEVKKGRPLPGMIKKLKKKYNIKSFQNIAKIGDTPADLLEGNTAGCGLNIGMYSLAYSKEELSIYPHTHLVKNLKEASGYILSYEIKSGSSQKHILFCKHIGT